MPLARLTSRTPDLTRAVDLVKKSIDPLLRDRYLSGQVITGLAVTAGTAFTVAHGLGRAWTGYEVVATSGSAMMILRNASTPATNPAAQISLLPSATGTISLRVF
jgi:hypothetical protein